MITTLSSVRSGLSSGSGSVSNTSSPAPGDSPLGEHREQGGLVDNRRARGIDEVGGRFHQREILRPDQAARAVAEHEMDRDEVRLRNRSSLLA